MTFYERIVILCNEKGIKPNSKELMKAAEVTSGTISNWKKKGAEPEKISTYSKIADYFGVTIDCLAGRTSIDTGIDEVELISIFRSLDRSSVHTLMATAYELRDKMTKEKTDSQDESAVG